MSPNPTTVYEEEFDDRDGQSLVVNDDGIGVLPGRLADGVGGGNSGDILPINLDSATELKYIGDCDLQLSCIAELESDCQLCESIFLKLKADCSKARSALEAAAARLRGYIRGLGIKMPLFDGGSYDSPAGENNLESGGYVCQNWMEDENLGIPDGIPGAGRSLGVGGAESPGSGRGVHGSVADKEAKGGDRNGAGAAADAVDDEGWKVTRLDGILPAGIAKKFEAEGLRTVGELSKFLNSGRSLGDIRGIGQSKKAEIEHCLEAFWAKQLARD